MFLKFGNMDRRFSNRPRLLNVVKLGKVRPRVDKIQDDVVILFSTGIIGHGKETRAKRGKILLYDKPLFLTESGKKLQLCLVKIDMTMQRVSKFGVMI